MTIDERIEALVISIELLVRGKNIRSLARIAEIHERRLTAL